MHNLSWSSLVPWFCILGDLHGDVHGSPDPSFQLLLYNSPDRLVVRAKLLLDETVNPSDYARDVCSLWKIMEHYHHNGGCITSDWWHCSWIRVSRRGGDTEVIFSQRATCSRIGVLQSVTWLIPSIHTCTKSPLVPIHTWSAVLYIRRDMDSHKHEVKHWLCDHWCRSLIIHVISISMQELLE